MPRARLVRSDDISREKFAFARELRKRMTSQEETVWERIRAGKIGFQFRRQQVVSGFIVDFLCARARLVVEIDGAVHDSQREEDERRDTALTEMGMCVLRIRNEDVDDRIDEVVERIAASCRVSSALPEASLPSSVQRS